MDKWDHDISLFRPASYIYLFCSEIEKEEKLILKLECTRTEVTKGNKETNIICWQLIKLFLAHLISIKASHLPKLNTLNIGFLRVSAGCHLQSQWRNYITHNQYLGQIPSYSTPSFQ